MRKLVALTLVGMSLVAFGCGGMVSKETKVKCPKCGAEFTVGEGLKAAEKTP